MNKEWYEDIYPACLDKLSDDEIINLAETMHFEIQQTGEGDDCFETSQELDRSYANHIKNYLLNFIEDRKQFG